MLTSKQIRILGMFIRNPFKEYTFSDLRAESKEKSNSVLQNAIKRFLDESIMTQRKAGSSKLCAINHANGIAYNYFDIFIRENLPKIVKKSIDIIREEIEKYTLFYSLVIFGSYSDGTNTKESDLDIAIIVPDNVQKNNIEIAVNSASNKSLLELDVHIITFDDFLEMLKADYENLAKEIARKNLPVYNISIFYRIIIKGIQNGFKIVS